MIRKRVLRLNWKLILMQLVVNGFAIGLTALILPGMEVAADRWGTFTLLALVFGLLNALVKPVVQFFTLSFLFVSYGFIVIVINTIMLLLLAWILPERIVISGLLTAILGGSMIGLLSLMLDTILGLTPPIFDDAVASLERE
jgi:putative membrane protein